MKRAGTSGKNWMPQELIGGHWIDLWRAPVGYDAAVRLREQVVRRGAVRANLRILWRPA